MAQDDTRGNNTADRSTDLQASPMMKHLMQSMDSGEDIGHYGRLVYAMVAQWFLEPDAMVAQLTKIKGFDETEARALVAEVKARGYNPPKANKIMQWQKQQDFPICPDENDPSACNVYDQLQFPDSVYENIGEYWEERVEAQSH